MSAPDPTTTIRTASEAGFAAARLMREAASVCPEVALRDPHGFWRGQAEMSLASLLYAASPAGCGGGITWAVRALDNTDPEFTAEPGWRQVEQLCGGHPVLVRGPRVRSTVRTASAIRCCWCCTTFSTIWPAAAGGRHR